MKEDLGDFTAEEKYLVKKMYEEGYTVQEIADVCKLSFYETIYVLIRVIDCWDLEKIVAVDKIPDQKVLIVSDTHLGSIYENMEYLKEAYQYARDNNIHTAFHCGDLMQSTFRNVQNIYQDERKQLEHIQRDYPLIEGMKNYILFGNHDYHTLRKDPDYFELLKEREDFYLLGFKRAYLSWQDHLISLSHTIKNYGLALPNVENNLILKGHSHRFSCKKVKSIDVPSLSDDLLSKRQSIPGFLVGDLENDCLKVESYYFIKDTLYQKKNPVLVRKI